MMQSVKQFLLDRCPAVKIWSLDRDGGKKFVIYEAPDSLKSNDEAPFKKTEIFFSEDATNFEPPKNLYKQDLEAAWASMPAQNPYVVYVSQIVQDGYILRSLFSPLKMPLLENFIGFEIFEQDSEGVQTTIYSNPTLDLFFLYDIEWVSAYAPTKYDPDSAYESYDKFPIAEKNFPTLIKEAKKTQTMWESPALYNKNIWTPYETISAGGKAQFFVRTFSNTKSFALDEFLFSERVITTEYEPGIRNAFFSSNRYYLSNTNGVHEVNNRNYRMTSSTINDIHWPFVLSIKKKERNQ